jgi:outer membrane lipoprotein-sorting protein
MDGLPLLHSVAEAYRNLTTLEIEALAISETRDEDTRQRGEQTLTFIYQAPNKIRMEQRGRHGIVTVSDGENLHNYFRSPNRYAKNPIQGRQLLPGSFQNEFPGSGSGSFLYQRIAERVGNAETLRSETLQLDGEEVPCEVVAVTYEPHPEGSFVVDTSPVLFWIDSKTRLVLRQEGEITVQRMRDDLPRTTKHTTVLTKAVCGQPVSPDAFEFTPPADATEVPTHGGGGFITSSGGSSSTWHIEVRSSHDWEGETLVERSHWTFLGHKITFERRISLSENQKEVVLTERITGPKDEQTLRVSVPMD